MNLYVYGQYKEGDLHVITVSCGDKKVEWATKKELPAFESLLIKIKLTNQLNETEEFEHVFR